MPIYDLFDMKQEERVNEEIEQAAEACKKDRFFSSLTARLLFFVLLIGDLIWIGYALTLILFFSVLHMVTFSKVTLFQDILSKQWLALKRASICAVALLVSLFSPALGIMVACMYFLMYDKTGIQEVIPSSLQEQFQEFMR